MTDYLIQSQIFRQLSTYVSFKTFHTRIGELNLATKTDKIQRSTILKNATYRLRRYAVDVVDTDRSVATSDKVFQDGAGESGYIGGWRDAHIFYCRSG